MRRGVLLAAVAATALLLTGCAPTISLRPAPEATSVGCAGIVVRLPDVLGGAARRDTDAQGTAAWGNPVGATLTCGVVPPEATTVNCVTFGPVDWLTQSKRIDGTDWNVYTTFGRVPATQVLVDPQSVSTDAVLNDLADPIAAATKVTAQCLSLSSTR